MNTQLKTLKILLLLTAFLLAGLTLAFVLRPAPVETRIAQGDTRLGGDFTLTSATGPVSLSDFAGQVAVIYIGYASCPDVCPTALAVLSQSLRNLEPAEREQVQGIFVSVDPEQDTPEKLAQYTAFFSPQLVGVTGSRQEIDQVVKQYGAFYRRVEMKDSALQYAIDHSSRLYLINRQGQLVQTLLHSSTPDELTLHLKQLLAEKG
jgi:protein SCO1/2